MKIILQYFLTFIFLIVNLNSQTHSIWIKAPAPIYSSSDYYDLSKDDKYLAFSNDYKIFIVDINSGNLIKYLEDENREIRFDSDSRYLYSINNNFKKWYLEDINKVDEYYLYNENREFSVVTNYFSSDNSLLLSLGSWIEPDETEPCMLLWNFNTRELLNKINFSVYQLIDLQKSLFDISNDNNFMTLRDLNGGLSYKIDLSTNKFHRLNYFNYPTDISNDSKLIIGNVQDSITIIRIIDSDSLNIVNEFSIRDYIGGGKFTKDLKYFNYISSQGLKFIGLCDTNEERIIEDDFVNSAQILLTNDCGKLIDVCCNMQTYNQIKSYSLETFRQENAFTVAENVKSLAFSNNSDFIALTDIDGNIFLLNKNNGIIISKIKIFNTYEGKKHFSFSNDSKFFLYADTYQVYEYDFIKNVTNKLLYYMKAHTSEISTCAYSSDDNLIVSGDLGGRVKIYDKSENKVVFDTLLEKSVQKVKFTNDDKYIIIILCNYNKEKQTDINKTDILLWNYTSGIIEKLYENPPEISNDYTSWSISISGDDKYIAYNNYILELKKEGIIYDLSTVLTEMPSDISLFNGYSYVILSGMGINKSIWIYDFINNRGIIEYNLFDEIKTKASYRTTKPAIFNQVAASISPNNEFLLSCTDKGILSLWKVPDSILSVNENKGVVTQENFTIFPNPASGLLNISYALQNDSETALYIYNSLGCTVYCKKEGIKEPGSYTMNIPTENLPSGSYFCRLQCGEKIFLKTLAIIK